MSQDLRTDLKTYMSYLDTQAPAISVDDIAPAMVPEADPVLNRRRGWLVAAAAAALTVVVIGSIAWLAPFGGQAPPAAEVPTPTTVELPPTTEAAVTTDTVPATTTTLAAVPVVPPGEGSKLSFVQAEAPTDGWLYGGEALSGEWFKGALYVVSFVPGDSQQLFRSTDGFTWELVPGLPEASDIQRTMLQTDGDRLVNVVMPSKAVGGDNRTYRSDAAIQVNTSTNGVDWTSSRITLPIPEEFNTAGTGSPAAQLDNNTFFSDNFAVGPKGIVVTATINLRFVADGIAMGLVNTGEGIQAEVVDLDLEQGVIIVQLWDEENSAKIGEPFEVDLEDTGFSGTFTNVLDSMATDPDWEPLIPGFLAQSTDFGDAEAVVGYAWFSADGVTWKRVESAGPLDGGEFASIVATPDGFVATASSTYRPSGLPAELRDLSESFDSSVVWQSSDGTTWTEATGLTTRHGFDTSRLVQWQGELVEAVGTVWDIGGDTEVWTLTDPPQRLFSGVPTGGMRLEISEFGLIGSPSYGYAGPDATELLYSVDGTSWNRWGPAEFDIGGSRESQGEYAGDAWIVGVGSDFVVVQLREWDEASASLTGSLWVGTVP